MLSKRLKAIASMVPRDIKIADVGCDHGLLDIYLTMYNNNYCTAIDISDGCILKTNRNIEKYQLTDKIRVIKNDGLSNLNVDDFDLIILSGLGMKTALDVLTHNVNHAIIQIQDDIFILRKRLSRMGFSIVDEVIVYDRGKYYIVMELKRSNNNYNYSDYLLGPVLRFKSEKEIYNYYNDLLSKYVIAIKKIPFKSLLKKGRYFRKIITIRKKLERYQ